MLSNIKLLYISIILLSECGFPLVRSFSVPLLTPCLRGSIGIQKCNQPNISPDSKIGRRYRIMTPYISKLLKKRLNSQILKYLSSWHVYNLRNETSTLLTENCDL